MKTYTYPISYFPNSKVNLTNLGIEIRESSISVAYDHSNYEDDNVYIIFKQELDSKDKSNLDNIVVTHNSTPKSNSVVNVNIIPENKKYVEEGNTTNDMYKAESWIIDVPVDVSIFEQDFAKPYNISLLGSSLKTTSDMIGDTICAIVAPNTVIGVLTADVSEGDTILNVSETVIQNLIPGRAISLDGLYNFEIGSVDQENNQITSIKPISGNFSAGNYVFMNIHLIKNMYIHTEQTIEIGKSISTGQRVPKNVPIRIRYWNRTGTAKKFAFFVEYLY